MKFYICIISAILVCTGFINVANGQVLEKSYERLFYFTDFPAGRTSLVTNIDKIDIFAPQSYSINKKLVAYGGVPSEVMDIVRSHKVKVMPLITNDGFDQGLIHNFLASSTAQDKAIDFMISEAGKNNYYGWQFDLEHIKSSDRELYSQFVEKTFKKFKKNNLVLSIAVVVRVDDVVTTDFYKNWSGAFDYSRLSKSVDFMSLMTYDDPNSKGPTASIPFVNKALKYVLNSGVPADKVSLGIPSYYWSWAAGPVPKRLRSGSYSRLLAIKARSKYSEKFDSVLGVTWLGFKERGVSYSVWYENKKSFDLKTKIMRDNNLRGFSMWVMGMEDPMMWK